MAQLRVETWKLVADEWVVPPGGLWIGPSRQEAMEYAHRIRLDEQTAVTVNRGGWGYVDPVAGQIRVQPEA